MSGITKDPTCHTHMPLHTTGVGKGLNSDFRVNTPQEKHTPRPHHGAEGRDSALVGKGWNDPPGSCVGVEGLGCGVVGAQGSGFRI